MNAKLDDTNQQRRQFITFRSGEQEFGADIMVIREIRGWTETTPLPHSPLHVRGVINLRGVVLPVVDLKALLGGQQTDANVKHVIVVMQAGDRTMGLLVDAVSDIMTVTASEIQPTPELARDSLASIVEGIAVMAERMVTILGIERLMETLVNGGIGPMADAA